MNYQVDLEVFSGPMDLLLYLIAKEEVDIHEVSLTRIVDQYMAYMEKMKELNVDITSDFIVMASTLLLIKSKALLPTEEIDLEEEIDQQEELIQHLLEYKRIKMLSRGLWAKAEHRSLLVPRPAPMEIPSEESLAYEELNLWDIIQVFKKIVKDTALDRSFQIVEQEKALSSYIGGILDILEEGNSVDFDSLFMGKKTRNEAICLFLGLLELVRRKMVTVYQSEDLDDLKVALTIDVEELKSMKKHGRYELGFFEEETRYSLSEEKALDPKEKASEDTSFQKGTEAAETSL